MPEYRYPFAVTHFLILWLQQQNMQEEVISLNSKTIFLYGTLLGKQMINFETNRLHTFFQVSNVRYSNGELKVVRCCKLYKNDRPTRVNKIVWPSKCLQKIVWTGEQNFHNLVY